MQVFGNMKDYQWTEVKTDYHQEMFLASHYIWATKQG